MALTFCIGDLLGKPKTPPDLLKEPCESCGSAEANHRTYDIEEGRDFSGKFSQIMVCGECLARFEPDDSEY